jgi:hypothetical protein
MKQERLIITAEIEDIDFDTSVLDFQIRVLERGWLTRVFRNWRRVHYKPAVITDLKVRKP